jgi:EAL domain-containing protein (putative c-di-GMP-specific phosphodiesterase class I)
MVMASDTGVPSRARVLLVDDEPALQRAFSRVLNRAGYTTVTAGSVAEALVEIEREAPDLVVSDLSMPGASGIDLLRAVRAKGPDLPVVFMTGAPSLQTAIGAVELGAFRYLTKPVDHEELLGTVADALRMRALTRVHDVSGERAALERALASAIDQLFMVFQPLVGASTRQIVGYEALMRSREPSLASPLAVLDAAEKLGALHELGRTVRARVAAAFDGAPPGVCFYVNVHVADLADADLFDPTAPLSSHAHRVVLELTERASLEGVSDTEERIARLRALGYRIAVDDLGAGYAGLSYFASVKPEIIKIDLSLVRDIDRDVVKKRVVASLTSLAKSLGIEVVAEGIETTAERDALIEIGCDLLQGYALARPGPPFPAITWA